MYGSLKSLKKIKLMLLWGIERDPFRNDGVSFFEQQLVEDE